MTAHRFAPAAALVAGAFALATVGCAPTTQNVRAYRAFAMEEASLKVTLDRIEDIARVMELVDKILSGTSYSPGDFWARRVAMGEKDAEPIREDIKRNYPYNRGDYEVPILKVYRKYLERVLNEYAPPPEKAKYPSLVDAVGALERGGRKLGEDWKTFRTATASLGDAAEAEGKLRDEIEALHDEGKRRARDPEFQAARLKTAQARAQVDDAHKAIERDMQDLESDATLTKGEREQVARDAFSAISVALRIEMEALAMIPIVIIDLVRSIPGVEKDMYHVHLNIVKQAWELPTYVTGVEQRLKRETAATEYMVGVLGRALKTETADAPGFLFKESLVDQIVGITLDSFRVDLHAGGEAFIYNNLQGGDRVSSKDGKTTYDYSGRQYVLNYAVQPIVLANARLDVSLDWIRLPGAANLGFGYSTDRVYSSGGTIQNTDLAHALGIDDNVSDVIDGALGLLGARSSVRIASWTAGTVKQVDANTGNVVDTAPLKLTQTQIDVGYDVLFAIDQPALEAWLEELVIDGRYLRYSLPRIVYELHDTSTVNGEQHFTYFRESPPQTIAGNYGMLGISTRIGRGEAPRFSPFLDLGIFGGAGPTEYYFIHDPTQPDSPTNRDPQNVASFIFDGATAAGLRVRLLPRASRLRIDLRAMYRADFFYTSIYHPAQSNGRGVLTDFGALDVFHGPSLALRASL